MNGTTLPPEGWLQFDGYINEADIELLDAYCIPHHPYGSGVCYFPPRICELLVLYANCIRPPFGTGMVNEHGERMTFNDYAREVLVPAAKL